MFTLGKPTDDVVYSTICRIFAGLVKFWAKDERGIYQTSYLYFTGRLYRTVRKAYFFE